MKPLKTTLAHIALATSLLTQPVFAQPSGLLLQSNGATGLSLGDADSRLHFRFKTEPVSASTLADTQKSLRSTIQADWPVIGFGLRTAIGLSWTSPDLNASTVTTPFLGLGWRSEPTRNSGWRLSAEMGTNLFNNSHCDTASLGCAALPAPGLNSDSAGSGLRLSPYLNFGASYRY